MESAVKIENVFIKYELTRIKEEVTMLETSDCSGNDLINFQGESYIKEEIMISDTSEISENQESDNEYSMVQQNILFVNFKKESNQLPPQDNIKTEYETERYKCTKCEGRFKDRYSLLTHKRMCGMAPLLNSEFCDYKAKQSFRLKDLKKVHKNFKTKKIKQILDAASAKDHKMLGNVPMDRKTFRSRDFIKLYCPKCEISFNRDKLKECKCPQCCEAALYQCLKCDKRYKNLQSMYVHVRSKCVIKEYFHCADCDYWSLVKDNLINHIKRIHTTVAPERYSKCSKCGKGFKLRCDCRIHEKICGKKRHLRCQFCPLKYKDKKSFNKHVERHILNLKDEDATFNAGSIDKKTTNGVGISKYSSKSDRVTFPRTSSALTENEKLRVKELTVAYCSECKRTTEASNGILTCSLCSNKLIYYCAECDKRYSRRSIIRQHIMRKHLVDNPKDQCPKCGECFVEHNTYDTYTLMCRHHNYCSKEPRFQCDHCPFKAKHKSNLVKHIQRHHHADYEV